MSLGAQIYANGRENIAVTSLGKLIGPKSGAVHDQIITTDVIENVVPLGSMIRVLLMAISPI